MLFTLTSLFHITSNIAPCWLKRFITQNSSTHYFTVLYFNLFFLFIFFEGWASNCNYLFLIITHIICDIMHNSSTNSFKIISPFNLFFFFKMLFSIMVTLCILSVFSCLFTSTMLSHHVYSFWLHLN